MNWTSMLTGVRDGSFFRDLGTLRPEELAGRLQWAPLFATARLWSWLRQDEGARCALAAPRCEDAWKTILAVLLERHLLDLNTRFDTGPLFEFWEWVTNAAECPGPIAKIWRENEADFRASCGVGSLSLEDIIGQEATFARLLLRAEESLRNAPSKMQWATDTVARLVARRSGGIEKTRPRRAFAQVVFAWDGEFVDDVRRVFQPALLIDFELGDQGASDTDIVRGDVFHETFRQSVGHVAERLIGRRRFHQLRYQPPPGIDLPPQSLRGGSGGLAILLTQLLANDNSSRRRLYFAIPPWVVITATLDPEAEGRARSVGAIDAKFRLLREMGVRVVVVADETEQLTRITRVLDQFKGQSGMATLRADRSPERTAERLIEHGCAWPADIEKRPLVSRRVIIAGLTVAALTGAGITALVSPNSKTVWMPVELPRPQTEAMKIGLALQSKLNEKAFEVQKHAEQLGIDSYLRKVLMATEIHAVPVWGAAAVGLGASSFGTAPLLAASQLMLKKPEFRPRPPAESSFRGLKVLQDSKFFDCTDWAEVTSLDELASKPIEPAYFTRVLRLQKTSVAPSTIAIEFNTGGLCVVPVVNESRRDKVYFCTKLMNESQADEQLTRTTYLVIDISKMGNGGQPFDLTVNAVYFNGSQDQRLRKYKQGPKKGQKVENDWWGTRVNPGTANADLAIRLPKSRSFHRVSHWVRKEDESGTLVPYKEVREGDPLWAPAGHATGTYTEGPDSVWVIPCETDDAQEFRWIYSLQWKWK